MKIEVGKQYVDDHGGVWTAVAQSVRKPHLVMCERDTGDLVRFHIDQGESEYGVMQLIREHRKPIDAYCTITPIGEIYGLHHTRAAAEEYARDYPTKGVRIIRLVEAPDA